MALVPVDAICQVLRPYLSSPLVEQTALCPQLSTIFADYAPYRDTLAQLATRLEQCLFANLYAALGEQMTLRRDDGVIVRVHMRDLPELADVVMEAFFRTWDRYSVNYNNLRTYAMETGSVSAMTVLCTAFERFLPDEDRQIMEKIIA